MQRIIQRKQLHIHGDVLCVAYIWNCLHIMAGGWSERRNAERLNVGINYDETTHAKSQNVYNIN